MVNQSLGEFGLNDVHGNLLPHIYTSNTFMYLCSTNIQIIYTFDLIQGLSNSRNEILIMTTICSGAFKKWFFIYIIWFFISRISFKLINNFLFFSC